jgi:hypothetical protein
MCLGKLKAAGEYQLFQFDLWSALRARERLLRLQQSILSWFWHFCLLSTTKDVLTLVPDSIRLLSNTASNT